MDRLLLGENIELAATWLIPALWPNVSRRQGCTCPLSAFAKFEQIALSGLAPVEKYQWCESWLVDCVITQQSKQNSAVFSKEVHMEGDSLCLPAAVTLLRPWLNGSVAICSGPRYRERISTVPISVISACIWLYMLHTPTTNTLLLEPGHERAALYHTYLRTYIYESCSL